MKTSMKLMPLFYCYIVYPIWLQRCIPHPFLFHLIWGITKMNGLSQFRVWWWNEYKILMDNFSFGELSFRISYRNISLFVLHFSYNASFKFCINDFCITMCSLQEGHLLGWKSRLRKGNMLWEIFEVLNVGYDWMLAFIANFFLMLQRCLNLKA